MKPHPPKKYNQTVKKLHCLTYWRKKAFWTYNFFPFQNLTSEHEGKSNSWLWLVVISQILHTHTCAELRSDRKDVFFLADICGKKVFRLCTNLQVIICKIRLESAILICKFCRWRVIKCGITAWFLHNNS